MVEDENQIVDIDNNNAPLSFPLIHHRSNNNNNNTTTAIDDDDDNDNNNISLSNKRKKKQRAMPKQARRERVRDVNNNNNNTDDDATNSNDLINEGSESSLETRKTYRHVRVNHGLKYRGDLSATAEARCSCVPSAPLEAFVMPVDVPPPPSDAVRFLPRRQVTSKAAAPSHSIDCGDHCVNRAMLFECDPQTCPCGKLCQNNVFRRRKYARVKTVRTPNKGIGLATAVPLKRGDFVIEYTGEIITESECVERMSANVNGHHQQHFLLSRHRRRHRHRRWRHWQSVTLHQSLVRSQLRDAKVERARRAGDGPVCQARHCARHRAHV
jgi:hypothetical protein